MQVMMVQPWRVELGRFGDARGGPNRVNLEAMIMQV